MGEWEMSMFAIVVDLPMLLKIWNLRKYLRWVTLIGKLASGLIWKYSNKGKSQVSISRTAWRYIVRVLI